MSRKVWQGNGGTVDDDATLFYGFVIRRNFRQSAVVVGDSATKIPATPLSNRTLLVIFNNSAQIVYIGNSSVTTADGYPIYPRGGLEVTIEDGVDIYGIVASSTADVRICEGS